MTDTAFAAGRSSTMSSYEKDLLPVVRAALAKFKPGTAWYAPIVDKAVEIGGDAVDSRQRSLLRASLRKTKDPENTAGSTDERVAQWISTYLVNLAEHASGDEDSTKTWITMHDDRVRHAHAALDGKTIPSKDTFDVDGARLSFPGQPVGDPSGWINCRCVLKTTKGNEMSLIADLGPNTDAENDGPAVDPADLPAENPDDPKVDDNAQVPFHGVATVTDRKTGDNRQLSSDGFSVRNLPLPLFYQRTTADGHGGSTIVGQFTSMALNDAGEVEYDGHFNFTPEAGEAVQGVAEGWLRGVSVDLDDTVIDLEASQPKLTDGMSEIEAMDAMQNAVTVFKQWRVSGLTMVGIPAFQEAFIKLGTRADAAAADQHDEPAATKDEQSLVAAAFAPGTHDGPGWITAPIPTGRIRRYWTHGEGAAKIGWGVPGDFNRCRAHLGKYIAKQEWLAGACANMHKEATGGWPGHAPTEASIVDQAAMVASAFNLVASVRSVELPQREWFENPQLIGPTPITIEGDHIYGHIATWGTCHIGLPGQCTTAPYSKTDYAWFRLGAVETTDGLVPVGQITMSTGHAGMRDNVKQAAAHYDNTGAAVADIATGEDEHGIWFSGRVRPGATADQRAELLGAKLSGDWREVNGNLELVAALAVNTPGFGIPRISLAASGQEQTALVAAGIVDEAPKPEHVSFLDQLPAGMTLDQKIDERIAQLNALAARRAVLPERTARLRELSLARRHDRVMAARQRLGR